MAAPFHVPTVEEFKNRFRSFDAVEDNLYNLIIEEAKRNVGTTWDEKDYTMALMLYVAHLLTLDGFGTSNEAKTIGFQSIRSGSLSLTRATGKAADAGSLYATSFGARYMALLRTNFPAVLVV